MSMRYLPAVIALSALLAGPAVAAEWAVREAPAEDGGLPAAAVTNADGHTLYLWPRHNGTDLYQIFAELHLAGDARFDDMMPRYRVDSGEIVDTELIRQAGESENALWGHVADKVAIWRAWSSDQAVMQPEDLLRDWVGGETLTVTYRIANGTTETTQFPLAGSGEAILEATGVRPE